MKMLFEFLTRFETNCDRLFLQKAFIYGRFTINVGINGFANLQNHLICSQIHEVPNCEIAKC
jgi:hypothetical protein